MSKCIIVVEGKEDEKIYANVVATSLAFGLSIVVMAYYIGNNS